VPAGRVVYTAGMGLLRPRHERKAPHLDRLTATVITCPYNGHQVGWCKGLCAPIAGVGFCGRPAAHALLGRTQLAIAAQMALQLATAE
jgi:hypothetical protein